MDEIWKDIVGYEGYYQVSNLGNAKRLAHYRNHSSGNGLRTLMKERILTLNGTNKIPYIRLRLSVEGKTTGAILHRAIAIAFLGIPKDGKNEVNHKDGNKHNNRLDNLEWVTRQENVKHANRTGLSHYAFGESSGAAKIDDRIAREIKQMLSNGVKRKNISKHFSISIDIIGNIDRGNTWKHI